MLELPRQAEEVSDPLLPYSDVAPRRAADLVALELERERRSVAQELIIERLTLELRKCMEGDSKKEDKVQGIVSLVQKLIKLL